MRVLLLFIDGVGLGEDDRQRNPLTVAHMPALRSLLGRRPLIRGAVPYAAHERLAAALTDPCLGVPGLPQSATGQTAIFTGVNAAQAIGRHLNAYPTPSLKAILQEHSIFRRVQESGGTATFLNAFRSDFFAWVQAGQPLPKDKRKRPSASVVAGLAAGVHIFRSLDQLQQGQAVGFDLDHSVMIERGFPVEPVAPEEAGRRAAQIAGQHDFTLYEHFLTDMAGHSQQMAQAIPVLERLDRFLGGLLQALPEDVLLMITSDHGNIEDLSVRTHTYNPVATICKGPGAAAVAREIVSLTDIAPATLRYLGRWEQGLAAR